MSTVVIVGASVGGMKTAQALRSEGHSGEIVIIEAEPVAHPYDKPPLSKTFLSATAEFGHIALLERPDLDAIGARIRTGVAAVGLDTQRKVIQLDDGSEESYDSLVIATGSRARRSPWGEGPGMHVLRTSADAERLRDELVPGRRLLIVGAGFIGAEVAATAVKAGVDVTMVDPLPAPMSRVLNEDIGRHFGAKHEEEGIRLVLGHTVTAVERVGETDSPTFDVTMSNGESITVDAVLVGIGAVVNTEWLEGSSLTLENGVVCNSALAAVGARDIYAVGDVCRWDHGGELVRLEHWTNAVDQALTVAHNIVADVPRDFHSVEYVWSDQYDWKIQVVGRTGSSDHEIAGLPASGRFAVTYADGEGAFVGAVIVNWPRAMIASRRAVADRRQAAAVREELQALVDAMAAAAEKDRAGVTRG